MCPGWPKDVASQKKSLMAHAEESKRPINFIQGIIKACGAICLLRENFAAPFPTGDGKMRWLCLELVDRGYVIVWVMSHNP